MKTMQSFANTEAVVVEDSGWRRWCREDVVGDTIDVGTEIHLEDVENEAKQSRSKPIAQSSNAGQHALRNA